MTIQNPPRGADEDAKYRRELSQAAAGRDRAPGVGRADSGSGDDIRARGFQPDRTLRHLDVGIPRTTSGPGPDNTLTTPGNPARRGRA